MRIHPTAIVEDGATLGADVEIGPMCHVQSGAALGDGVILHSHVVVTGAAELGANCVVHPFAVVGGVPQHTAYKGEPTKLIIGEKTIIREHVTMNCGTVAGGGVTRVGANGFFMTASHVAHDCQIGDGVIFANNATIGGHVQIGDGAILGGLCAIHQNERIGDYAFVGGCAAVVSDLIPYASAFGNHAHLSGLNLVGLKRRQTPRSAIHELRRAYKVLFAPQGTLAERVEQVRTEFSDSKEVARIIAFIDAGGARSIMTPAR